MLVSAFEKLRKETNKECFDYSFNKIKECYLEKLNYNYSNDSESPITFTEKKTYIVNYI